MRITCLRFLANKWSSTRSLLPRATHRRHIFMGASSWKKLQWKAGFSLEILCTFPIRNRLGTDERLSNVYFQKTMQDVSAVPFQKETSSLLKTSCQAVFLDVMVQHQWVKKEKKREGTDTVKRKSHKVFPKEAKGAASEPCGSLVLICNSGWPKMKFSVENGNFGFSDYASSR